MGGSGTVALATVAAPNVGGVQITRQALHFEAQRSLGIARKVGRRLVRWLIATDKKREPITRVVGRDPETGRELREEIHGEDGKPMMGPILPDEEFRKSWETYERTVRNLLVEQRARAAMTPANGAPPMSDEDFQASIAQLARQAVLEMPRGELEELLRARHVAIVAGATDSPNKASETTGTPTQEGDDETHTGGKMASRDASEHESASVASSRQGQAEGNGDLFDFGNGDGDT